MLLLPLFPQGTYKAEPDCGRPLGLRFDREEKTLIVCDAYYGLLQVDPNSGEVKTLVSAKEGMDGHPFAFTNDLVIASDNIVYFTDSSFKWNRRDNRYAVMEGGGQGRLMSYNLKTGEKATLVSGLFFANGVTLSPDEDFVLVTETSASRIIRFVFTFVTFILLYSRSELNYNLKYQLLTSLEVHHFSEEYKEKILHFPFDHSIC